MKLIRNPELRGILILVLVIIVVGAVLAISTGKLEQWLGITIFSGPKALDKIIFVSDRSGSSEIYSMNPDGAGQTQLTRDARVLSTPAISPSGNRIAFVGRYQNQDQVFSTGADGGSLDRLTSATGPKKQPAFSPNGRKLSFIAGGKVYVAELNGDDPEPVLPTPMEVHAAMAGELRRETPAYYGYSWGSDGNALTGVTRDEADNDLLVYLPSHDAEPRMIPSPGSSWHVLIDQVLQKAANSGKRDMSDKPVKISGIGWAADAPVFAVSIVTDSDSYLMLLAVEKGQLGIVGIRPFEGQEIGAPSTSPDGSTCVVAARSLGKKAVDGVLKVDLHTGSVNVIAGGTFENPSYSPDGDMVLAVKVDGDKKYIVSINPATGEVKQLTTDGQSYGAIWSPTSEK